MRKGVKECDQWRKFLIPKMRASLRIVVSSLETLCSERNQRDRITEYRAWQDFFACEVATLLISSMLSWRKFSFDENGHRWSNCMMLIVRRRHRTKSIQKPWTLSWSRLTRPVFFNQSRILRRWSPCSCKTSPYSLCSITVPLQANSWNIRQIGI